VKSIIEKAKGKGKKRVNGEKQIPFIIRHLPFMGFSIAQAIHEAARVLREAGVSEARRDASLLLAHVAGRSQTFLIAHDDELKADETQQYRQAILRRASGEPVQYITGHQEFFRLDFEVTPDVLIPRPETELLVEAALTLLREMDVTRPRICDVGTGSGCILISILHEEKGACGLGLDVSHAALDVAARNAERLGVAERIELIESDCFDVLQPDTKVEMIVSNPPYVAEKDLDGLQREVREHEPLVALSPGADGLGIIRKILRDAPRFLTPNGHLLMEIGFDQHERVSEMINPKIWTLLDIHKDLQGIPRTVALRKVAR